MDSGGECRTLKGDHYGVDGDGDAVDDLVDEAVLAGAADVGGQTMLGRHLAEVFACFACYVYCV